MSDELAIIVTAAVIEADGLVLIAQRPPGGRHPGEWEFPGGKVEPGETSEDCVRRELVEELGIEVRVGRRLASIRHSYPDLEIELVAYACEITSGAPADIECSAHQWVPPEALPSFELLPPDRVMARELFGGIE
ncbi:MAG: (deoxy)nucleoside triphosphate pyrophosphohydrolase [Candidatus Geothermincolia bacterium]